MNCELEFFKKSENSISKEFWKFTLLFESFQIVAK